MRKLAFLACAAALTFGYAAIGTVQADDLAGKASETLKAQDGKLPKAAALKTNDGTDEGHKSAQQVVAKAIKAAKDKKLGDLKACLSGDARRNADEKSWSSSDGSTHLQELAKTLATYSDEGQSLLKQNTVGNYAVVMCSSPLGTHMVRAIREAQEGEAKEGEEPKKGPENWYLTSYQANDYETNYNSPQVKQIIDVINKGEVSKLKEFLDPWETQGLELLAGVKEGADPYDLLAARLKQIITNGEGKPTLLLHRYSSEVAFWFNSEKGDTFIVLSFWNETDWDTKKKSTTARISFNNTAQFHKGAANTFEGWVDNYDYSRWK
ncbi:MAG: hypothetical protein KF754_07810 [Planctomycetes bacterium]|nr:hypothetical protein [Planctomycetota bacterium]